MTVSSRLGPLLCSLLAVGQLAGLNHARAQNPPASRVAGDLDISDLPEMLPAEWITRHEQACGLDGLYVEESASPSDDPAGRTRTALVIATRAARRMTLMEPAESPTSGSLLAKNYLKEPLDLPDGMAITWDSDARIFRAEAGPDHQLDWWPRRQFRLVDDYRRAVAEGSPLVWREWRAMATDPSVPPLVRHEIETRRFSISFHDSPLVRGATETQRLLRQLDDAIQLAVAGGLLDAATTITMQQVGRTGLIDMLPALPAGGRYVVERSDKPPHALFGDRRINLSPAALAEQIAAETRRIASDRPDYPPALALRARYEDPEAALATVTRAIELWPDVPALRIQRIALRSRLLRVEELPEDLDYLLARFPSTPILLEIDTATRQGALATEPTFRVGLALSLAELRPEVLPIQLLALRECLEHGDRRAAIRIYDRLVQRHPGYEQVVVNPRRL